MRSSCDVTLETNDTRNCGLVGPPKPEGITQEQRDLSAAYGSILQHGLHSSLRINDLEVLFQLQNHDFQERKPQRANQVSLFNVPPATAPI